ncbi:MAG: cation:proton antiporter [Thermoplasmata archaeon]|nr:cation:proton antiporter [Thermoplasmata archaeon]
MIPVLPFGALLAGALLVAYAAHRARIPVTLGLVLFGVSVGLLTEHGDLGGINDGVRSLLSPTVFFELLLPPIVFEAALHIDARRLRARAPLVLFLVFVGVIFTTVFTGYLLGLVAAVPLAAALLIAAILSPTDPVAVVDLSRRLDVPAELSTIVESESILNDAIGIILFLVLLGWVTGAAVTPAAIVLRFAWLILGGVAVGGATAVGVHVLLRPLKDPIAGTAISLVAAYGSFLVATGIGASGIIATAIAGLAVGTWVLPHLQGRDGPGTMVSFWTVVVYGVNAVIFLAMGLLFGASTLVDDLPLIALVFLLITLGRAIFVYAHRPLARSSIGDGAVLPGTWYDLLALAGVRGAIPVVLALSLETTVTDLAPSTVRTVVATVLGVVLVSLLVNNLASEWYVNHHFAPRTADGPPMDGDAEPG